MKTDLHWIPACLFRFTHPDACRRIRGEDCRCRAGRRASCGHCINSLESGERERKLPDGTSALHWAVTSEDLEIVSLLLQAKADVNAADPHGITPLALACANANVEIVRTLIARWSQSESGRLLRV